MPISPESQRPEPPSNSRGCPAASAGAGFGPVKGPSGPTRFRRTLKRLALSGDSAEAVQPNELQEHRPCLSPERAILFNDRYCPDRPATYRSARRNADRRPRGRGRYQPLVRLSWSDAMVRDCPCALPCRLLRSTSRAGRAVGREAAHGSDAEPPGGLRSPPPGTGRRATDEPIEHTVTGPP
jgi:hypothetical protein